MAKYTAVSTLINILTTKSKLIKWQIIRDADIYGNHICYWVGYYDRQRKDWICAYTSSSESHIMMRIKGQIGVLAKILESLIDIKSDYNKNRAVLGKEI